MYVVCSKVKLIAKGETSLVRCSFLGAAIHCIAHLFGASRHSNVHHLLERPKTERNATGLLRYMARRTV